MELSAIIEALVFASPEPITSKAIARCIRAKVTVSEEPPTEPEDFESPDTQSEDPQSDDPLAHVKAPDVEKAILELNATYEEQGRSFRIMEGPHGWRMFTTPEYAEWIEELFPGQKPSKLSPPALETLAIIAYRQPITKADVEAVRGVSVDGVLQKVIDRGLIKIVGRAQIPGRPLLYGTTDLFMEHFGIKKLEDLPNSTELRRIQLPQAEEKDSGAKEKDQQLALADEPEEAASEGEAKERRENWSKMMRDDGADTS